VNIAQYPITQYQYRSNPSNYDKILFSFFNFSGVCFGNLNLLSVVNSNAQNTLDTFPCKFPVDREVAILLRTCYGLVVYVADLAAGKLPTCYGLAAGKLV